LKDWLQSDATAGMSRRAIGAWQKMRVNQGQEFVIAGYRRSANNFEW